MESLFRPCKSSMGWKEVDEVELVEKVDIGEGEGKMVEVDAVDKVEVEEGRERKDSEIDGETTEEEDEQQYKIAKERRQQQCSLPPSREFLQAVTRWGSLKEFPDRVTKEIDSLLSLLSPSIICPAGQYVAVNVSSLRRNRLVWIVENDYFSHFSSFLNLI